MRLRGSRPTRRSYAALSFFARYRGDTLRAYTQDLKAFLGWCAERGIEPLQAQRPHLELYLRWMEQRGLAPATIGRRFTTVAGFYCYAVIDGHCDKDPSLAVTRPRVPWEGQRRTMLHPLEYAALLTAARRDGPGSHALVALLGMIGLRVSEATNINSTDLRSQSGYELLTVMGKAPSRRSFRSRFRCSGRYVTPPTGAAQGRSCSTGTASASAPPPPPAACAAWPRSPDSPST